MFTEAINTYSLIVKNKQYPQSGRLRVNMGNIYYQDVRVPCTPAWSAHAAHLRRVWLPRHQKKYTFAIKMYRMALDQIPNTGKEMRLKIMRNIGNAFVRLGQFPDAIQSFETIMDGNADFQTGFNLIVCYYALGDEEKMRKGFARLLSIPMPHNSEDEVRRHSVCGSLCVASRAARLVVPHRRVYVCVPLIHPQQDDEDAKEVETDTTSMRRDQLREELKERQKKAVRYITMASKLIAPALDQKDWGSGFEWVIETLKHEHELIAGEIQISKALTHLRKKEFDRVRPAPAGHGTSCCWCCQWHSHWGLVWP